MRRRSAAFVAVALLIVAATFSLEGPANASARKAAKNDLRTPVHRHVPSGDLTLDGIAVGSGATFGDWSIWRPDGTHLLMTHPGGTVAVEVVITSNGWFHFSQGRSDFIVWSTGEHNPADMDVDPKEYYGRETRGALATSPGKLGTWAYRFEGGDLLLICDADNETIIISPRSPHFRYITFMGRKVDFPQ